MIFDLAKFNDNTAIITDDGRTLSYCDLKRMSDEWASGLPSRSLVFLLVGNHLESLVSYVGCLNHGVVPLMLSENIDAGLLEELKRRYRPDAVFRNGEPAEDELVCAARRDAAGTVSLHPELSLLITTSGSTGAPKLVRQSYRNIQANAESIAEYLKIDATERPITTLPMNYVYGLSIINSHLIRGATILLTSKTLMQREFWNFFNEQKATAEAGEAQRQALAEFAAQRGVAFKDFSTLEIPDEEWGDVNHVNWTGSRRLTEAVKNVL